MKETKTSLRKKLDTRWAERVKEKGYCEYCGKETHLNAHHFYSRTALSTRWELDNGFCLCSGHHVLISKFSAHKSPADFVEWAVKKRGIGWYDRLRKKHEQIAKFTIDDYKEKLKGLND